MATKFDNVRAEIMARAKELFESMGYDVLTTGSQELCLPIVNADGNESYLVIPFKIPKGSRDGDAYDGYAMAQEYEMKQREKAEKAAEKAKAKAAKIAKDKAAREEKAKAKAEQPTTNGVHKTIGGEMVKAMIRALN